MYNEVEYLELCGGLRCSDPDDKPSFSDADDKPGFSDADFSDADDKPSLAEEEEASAAAS